MMFSLVLFQYAQRTKRVRREIGRVPVSFFVVWKLAVKALTIKWISIKIETDERTHSEEKHNGNDLRTSDDYSEYRPLDW